MIPKIKIQGYARELGGQYAITGDGTVYLEWELRTREIVRAAARDDAFLLLKNSELFEVGWLKRLFPEARPRLAQTETRLLAEHFYGNRAGVVHR